MHSEQNNVSGLILIPTDGERASIETALQYDERQWSIHTVGFGVIAAGIESYRAVLTQRPTKVILAGIAGLFASSSKQALQMGDAIWFDSIAIDGIGVGQADAFIDAIELGWNWNHDAASDARLQCQTPEHSDPAMLLTVCSGSANEADALRRSQRFPDAIGEDMEAYAVAHACRTAGVPLSIVRGFSNIVGQRDKSDWCVDQALASVAKQLQSIIDGHSA